MRVISIMAVLAVSVLNRSILALGEQPTDSQGVLPYDEAGHAVELQIRSMLSFANRLVLEWNGEEPLPQELKRLEIIGFETVQQLGALVRIDPRKTFGETGAMGVFIAPEEFTLRVFNGTTEVATLAFPVDGVMRWVDNKLLEGDIVLTPHSAMEVAKWLAAHGFGIYLARQEVAAAVRELETVRRERFIVTWPSPVQDTLRRELASRTAVDDMGKRAAWINDFALACEDAVGDKVQIGVHVCRALGTIADSWRDVLHEIALGVMKEVGTAVFEKVLGKLDGDKEGLLGAAELFFNERYGQRVPKGFSSPWSAKLAEHMFLHGGFAGKKRVLDMLEDELGQESCDLVRRIANGTIKSVDSPSEDQGCFPNIRYQACLWLARHGEDDMRRTVERLLHERLNLSMPDKAALEVSLALMGARGHLRVEHFDLQMVAEYVSFAALDAIERFGGLEGMDLLVGAALDNTFVQEDALLLFQRLTGNSWYVEGGEGGPSNFVDVARQWWSVHGAAFVECREKRKEH